MSYPIKVAVVLGASYGGARAAQLLAQGLPEDWTVLLVDRNSHANHLYVLPRLAVLPGHEHKAFIPYTNVFHPHTPAPPHASSKHIFLHAHVRALTSSTVTLSSAFPEHGLESEVLQYGLLVYALGSRLPPPIDLWGDADLDAEIQKEVSEGQGEKKGTKAEGIAWLKQFQRRVKDAQSVLVVGGGALGIQYATDIADLYPDKAVTLLHSRDRLLPRFDAGLHYEVVKTLESLRVTTLLSTRLDLASALPENAKVDAQGRRVVRTTDGREVAADLLKPQTALLSSAADAFEGAVNEAGFVRVRRTMQIATTAPSSWRARAPHGRSATEESTWSLDGLSLSDSEDHSVLPSLFDSASGSEAEAELEDLQHLANELSPSELVPIPISNDAPPSPLTSDAAPPPDSEDEGSEEEEEVDAQYRHLHTLYPHIFAIGDAADAFGAIKAGHTAYFQAEVAARNAVRLVRRWERASGKSQREETDAGEDGETEKLESYTPGPPAVKVSLGLGRSVFQTAETIGTRDGDADDLGAPLMWGYFGMGGVEEEGMFA